MTADNVRLIENIPEYTSTPKTDTGPKPEVRFKFDGQVYTLTRPKSVILMRLVQIREGDMEAAGWDTFGLISSVIGYINEEPPTPDGKLQGRAHLMHRLSDPRDSLDVEDLIEPFMHLVREVFDRPTGSPAGSAKRPARTSKGGAASTRSKPAVTSTT